MIPDVGPSFFFLGFPRSVGRGFVAVVDLAVEGETAVDVEAVGCSSWSAATVDISGELEGSGDMMVM